MQIAAPAKERVFFAALAVIAASILALVIGAGQAGATSLNKLTLENAKGTCKVTTSLGQNWGDDTDYSLNESGVYSSSGSTSTVTNLKSSKPSVVAATLDWDGSGPEGNAIMLTFKKAGTAKVSYTWKGKKHTVKFVVKKYTNPLKLFKIGSKKFTAKFKKNAVGYYGPLIGGKLQIKAKANWKPVQVKTIGADYGPKSIKNGSTLKKGKAVIVLATFKNKKTGVVQQVTLVSSLNYGG